MFILAGNRLSKQLAQLIELPVRFFELLGEKPDAFNEHADMRDGSFLTRQIMELVPSAWQAARIMEDTLATLRARRIPIEQIFASRLDLVADMLRDLREQIDASAESLFRQLLADGVLSFELIGAADPELDWHVAETIEMHVSDSDRILAKRNGMPLERSLFEHVYERDINGLERDVALYLDDADAIKWWHRLVRARITDCRAGSATKSFRISLS